MNETAKTSYGAVPPEEVDRRYAEYRRMGFECRMPAHAVYHPEHRLCPWSGCGLPIAGIDFQLDRMGEPALTAELVSSFWLGPGLVGRCPRCGRYVLFGMREKLPVTDLTAFPQARLPEDWATKAHLVPKPTAV